MTKPVCKCCSKPNMRLGSISLQENLKFYICDNCGKEDEEPERYSPEIGKAVFGAPWGEYDFDSMKDSEIIEYMLRIISYFATDQPCYSGYFENDVFALRPYYWGDDEEEAQRPNFLHKKSGLEIRWYKYIGRGMSVNRKICPKCFLEIFVDCLKSLFKKEVQGNDKASA